MKRELLRWLACPCCENPLELKSEDGDEVWTGNLFCSSCRARYEVTHGVPVLLDKDAASSRTSRLYGDIWDEYGKPARRPQIAGNGYRGAVPTHLDLLRLAAGWDLVAGSVGIDAGCGDGSSVVRLADEFSDVHFVGVDLSTGPYVYATAASERENAHLVRGNLLRPPLPRESFDFALSFGVLHHTPDPEGAFGQLLERLRPGGRITIFLYKDFSDIPVKRFLLRQVNRLRRVTTRMPPRALRALAWSLAPLVFLALTLPARAMRAVGAGRFARHIPYGTFPHITGIASSLQDRFGAPYEFRYSAADLDAWARRAGLVDSRVVDCLPLGYSGLVLAGLKPPARPEDRARIVPQLARGESRRD